SNRSVQRNYQSKDAPSYSPNISNISGSHEIIQKIMDGYQEKVTRLGTEILFGLGY
ncbi:unnamed protein product, partial [marine sediment metagenome]